MIKKILAKLDSSRITHRLIALLIITLITLILSTAIVHHIFVRLIDQREQTVFTNMVWQIRGRVNAITDSIVSTSRINNNSKVFQDYVMSGGTAKQAEAYVVDSLTTTVSTNQYLQNIKLYFPKTRTLSSEYDDPENAVIYAQIIDTIDAQSPRTAFFQTHPNNETALFSYIDLISPMDGLRHDPLAYSISLYSTEIFMPLLEELEIPSGTLLVIADRKGSTLLANNAQLLTEPVQAELKRLYSQTGGIYNEASFRLYEQNGGIYSKAAFNEKEYIFATIIESSTGFRITCLVPENVLTKDLLPIRRIALAVVLLASFIIAIFIIGTTLSINTKFRRLNTRIQYVRLSDLSFRFAEEGPDELREIERMLNEMLNRLESAIASEMDARAQAYQSEILKQQAELIALQNQINPHFLYNTLECIRSIAMSIGCSEIARISTCMASIFRYCIKGSDQVTLKDELKCVRDYFQIITIRYMGRFTLEIDVDEALLNIPVKRMILQPLVENAVVHGLERCMRPGIVNLSIFMERAAESILCITVSDNGAGMDEKTMNAVNQAIQDALMDDSSFHHDNTGLALRNIARRVKAESRNASLVVQSQLNKGTQVDLRLPCCSESQAL